MKETLENILSARPELDRKLSPDFFDKIEQWASKMQPVAYSCLGCKHCYPAVATNIINESFPEIASRAPACSFEVRKTWPPVPGEYFVLCKDSNCPVAVSTLASVELAEQLSLMKPRGLCIVGKTETENIGIDKIIKNVVANPAIRTLIVTGKDSDGHKPGKTLLALYENGVDKNMKVVGSPGRNPVLRNVSRREVGIFRHQVEVIDLIGLEDEKKIVRTIGESIQVDAKPYNCAECKDEDKSVASIAKIIVEGEETGTVVMDKAGYFVIIPQQKEKVITVEHYSYKNQLLRTIEGRDARTIYKKIIENGYVTRLSHAAYLGMELEKAELSLKYGFKYTQDGA